MPKKIIIETEEHEDDLGRGFKEEFRRMHEHRPHGGDRVRKHVIRLGIEKERKTKPKKKQSIYPAPSYTSDQSVLT